MIFFILHSQKISNPVEDNLIGCKFHDLLFSTLCSFLFTLHLLRSMSFANVFEVLSTLPEELDFEPVKTKKVKTSPAPTRRPSWDDGDSSDEEEMPSKTWEPAKDVIEVEETSEASDVSSLDDASDMSISTSESNVSAHLQNVNPYIAAFAPPEPHREDEVREEPKCDGPPKMYGHCRSCESYFTIITPEETDSCQAKDYHRMWLKYTERGNVDFDVKWFHCIICVNRHVRVLKDKSSHHPRRVQNAEKFVGEGSIAMNPLNKLRRGMLTVVQDE